MVQVLSTYDRDLRDPLWWPQERPVPLQVAPGPLGIPLPSMPWPKTLCGVGAGTLGFPSSADMVLGSFWSLPCGVSPRLEWGQARAISSRAVAEVSCSRRVVQVYTGSPSRFSHEAFPRGFPTGLSQVPLWCEAILGLKFEALLGENFSLEWTETPGGLWEWWHDPGVPLAFPVESASS